MFGGVNIDLSKLASNQDFIRECAAHPGCAGCKYYKLPEQGDTNICETAVAKIRVDNSSNV